MERPPSVATATSTMPSILIVDDDLIIRGAAADFLRSYGYQVVEATRVAEAVFLLHNAAVAVDLVFASVEKPGLHGLELARWVRQHRPELPILMTSSSARTADLGDDLCSIGPIVSKPYRGDAMARRIRSRLRDMDGAEADVMSLGLDASPRACACKNYSPADCAEPAAIIWHSERMAGCRRRSGWRARRDVGLAVAKPPSGSRSLADRYPSGILPQCSSHSLPNPLPIMHQSSCNTHLAALFFSGSEASLAKLKAAGETAGLRFKPYTLPGHRSALVISGDDLFGKLHAVMALWNKASDGTFGQITSGLISEPPPYP